MMAHDLTWARDCAYAAVALIVVGLGLVAGALFRGQRRVYFFTDDDEDENRPT